MTVCLACREPWSGHGLQCPTCRAGERPKEGPSATQARPKASAPMLDTPSTVDGNTWHFVLPLPRNLTNAASGKGHWWADSKDRRAYWEALDNRVVVGLIPRPPSTPIQRATAHATLYVWSRMDDVNAMARLKWPEDWLVRRGYLADDSREHLRWDGPPDQVVDRKRQRLEITVQLVAMDRAA